MRNSRSSTTTSASSSSSSRALSLCPRAKGLSPAFSSPSFSRRRALNEADAPNQIEVIDEYPLSKYLAMAERLFACFQQSFEHLNLDEAFVYGMRFAQLGLVELPRHGEWRAGGEREERLGSLVEKALSRLEIIKRRMDEEELTKLRVGMVARAEEEARAREREQERERARARERPQSTPRVPTERKEERGGIGHRPRPPHEHETKSAGSKLRKFFRLPKKSGGVSAPPPAPQTVLPSLGAIQRSRARHEWFTGPNDNDNYHNHPVVVATDPSPSGLYTTRYAIEEYPLVEQVTLRLHPTRTPSLLNLERGTGPKSHEQRVASKGERGETTAGCGDPSVPPLISLPSPSLVSSPLPPPLLPTPPAPLPHTEDESILSETKDPPPCRIADRDRADAAASNAIESCEATERQSCVPASSGEPRHAGSSTLVPQASVPSPVRKTTKERMLEEITARLKLTHGEDVVNNYARLVEETEERVTYSAGTGCHRPVLWPGRGCGPKATEAFAKRRAEETTTLGARTRSSTSTSSFDAFDAFLARRAAAEEDDGDDEEGSYMEVTVVEEADEEKSYFEYVIEEDCGGGEGYPDRSFPRERAQSTTTKAGGTGSPSGGSPTCVASEVLVPPCTSVIPDLGSLCDTFDPPGGVSVVYLLPFGENDDATCLTMDE
ncbi:unnamed protein product [Pseudo-nitzschia multistriata]|uniref:USP8 dimerisation domain-containing protein n=1 Tax=Pseudo-nitzschia multistriata TaxID=183589 RepID=A0A448YYC6_9STRA|nr:unnamed protein product [Pseudo-nitzschia multistriata]